MKYSFPVILILIFFCTKGDAIKVKEAPLGDIGIQPVSVKTLTQTAQSQSIINNNPENCWESAALLPQKWLSVLGSNFFLNRLQFVKNFREYQSISQAFDGDLDSAAEINAGTIEINLPSSTDSRKLAFKLGFQDEVNVEYLSQAGLVIHTSLISKAQNYQLIQPEIDLTKVAKLKLSSSANFQLFEIGLRNSPVREKVLLDFGEMVSIKFLEIEDSRSYADIEGLDISIKKSKGEFEKIKHQELRENLLEFAGEQKTRFVLLEYIFKEKDWQKIKICEIKAYDKIGLSGKRPTAKKSKMPLKKLLGINAYWGFGHNKYSKFIPEGQGPQAFSSFISHFRNYHDMTWDVNDPDEPIDYKRMAEGNGTPAKNWVNWDLEYEDWKAQGVDIQASLQFFRFKPEQWDNPEQSAYNYAFAFVRHFGPTHGNRTVQSIEVGNEPWKYDAATYQKILLGMVRGAKAGDPAIEIFPCALQAANPDMEKTDVFKNYINARIPQEIYPYLDGINVHHYSYTSHNVYTQKSLRPESASSVFWEVNESINWRNANMPNKKIYLSEWGWDSSGGGEDCTHIQCVPEQAAANYLVRGALIAHRLGLDRASWFFHGNETGESRNYARSGLLSSAEANFAPKKTYYAMKNLVELLGDKHFIRVYQENDALWGYYYGDENGKATHLVLWRPFAQSKEDIFVLSPNVKAVAAQKINYIAGKSSEVISLKKQNNGTSLYLGETPVIVELEK